MVKRIKTKRINGDIWPRQKNLQHGLDDCKWAEESGCYTLGRPWVTWFMIHVTQPIIHFLLFMTGLGHTFVKGQKVDWCLSLKRSIEISSSFTVTTASEFEANSLFSSRIHVRPNSERWNLPCGKTLRRTCRRGDWSRQRSHCRCDGVRSIPGAHSQDSCWRSTTETFEQHWKNVQKRGETDTYTTNQMLMINVPCQENVWQFFWQIPKSFFAPD